MYRQITAVGVGCMLLTACGCRMLGIGGTDGLRYRVEFRGAEPQALQDAMAASSQCVAREGEPTAEDELVELCLLDEQLMLEVLHSEGYYLGEARCAQKSSKKRDAVVQFHIKPGPRFRLSNVDLQWNPTNSAAIADAPPLVLKPGHHARAEAILGQQKLLQTYYRNHGYPWAEVSERRVVVSRSKQEVAVTYTLTPGPHATFGPATFTGSDRVREKHLRRYVAWTEGAPYNERLTQELKSDLLAGGLFSSVQVSPATAAPDENGTLPLTVALRDRKQRSVTLGLQYWSDDGIGANFSWQHRNMRRAGETLAISMRGSSRELHLETRYEVPYFRRRDQSAAISAMIEDEFTDAYDARVLSLTVGIKRDLTTRIDASGALRAQQSRIEEPAATNTYELLSAPILADINYAGDILNPTEGIRVRIYAEPFIRIAEPNLSFLRTAIDLRGYLPLDKKHHYVIAARGGVGSIVGESHDSIPANLRFYAGGGGSIRGYEYQSVGPTVDGYPIGGLTMAQLSLEVRARVMGDFALATFADGGMVYEESVPDSGSPFQWGVGGGIRYHTPLGPLRVDIAFPVDREPDNTTTHVFYISLGQAF